MSLGGKFSLGALGRLALAGGAVYTAAHLGDAQTAAALATVAAGYLTARANITEDRFIEKVRESKNHHLQLALAGSFRLALDNLEPPDPACKSLFDSWQAILNAALDPSTDLLAVVIPVEFDSLLDAANPHASQNSALEETESLLRFWLAYQQAFERTRSYPAIPPTDWPELPPHFRQFLQSEFLPEFQRAFDDLLTGNDATYARRAFEHRQLRELTAASRKHTRILERLDAQHLLPLVPLRPPAPLDPARELDILLAESRAIAVVGREADLSSLHAWLASEPPISVRILTGPAGAGKTRLAIQLLEHLSASNYRAGFLRESGLAIANQRQWDQPTLAIVDYAASVAQPLKVWLAHLADQAPARPLRILLLEREANPEAGWLRALLDHTSASRRIASFFDPAAPQRVTPLAGVGLRRQILEATLKKLGAKHELPPPGKDVYFDRRLAEPRWQDPLYLMMAVLNAREPGRLVESLSLNRAGLAFRLADRELDRIGKFLPAGAQPELASLLARLAGIVTACRSLDVQELVAVAKKEATIMGFEFPGGPRVAAERVVEAMSRGGKPAPIEPDIIGEAALLRVFGGENLQEGTRALVRAARRAGHRHAGAVCFAITRATQDFASDECQDPLHWVEEFIRSGDSDDLDLLLALEAQMPSDTLFLREPAMRVDRLLLARFKKILATGPTEQVQSSCARFANNLALRLSDLGRREEALQQAEDAVRIRRKLAEQRPDAFLPDLAASLNNVANMLSDLGRREGALEQAEEAVRLYRKLSEQRPHAFLPDLAMSLNNLATMLSALGRREEALQQAEDAVRLYRKLAEQRPDAFLPDLAMSLNNVATMLSALGRREEALQQAEDAVRLYRKLAEQRPDAFLPDLAMSLNNVATMLSALGRREEALQQAEDAVRISRKLSEQRPDAFLPDLAMSLNNVATRLSALGRREEALQQAEEAVRFYRKLADQRPDAFLPDLAMSLNNVANRLSALGRREEALQQAQEAVRLYRNLAEQRPDAFLPDLAASLNNLATTLSALGRREEALQQAEEAVRLYRNLADQRPDAFLPDLAASLNNVANRLSALGRREEALQQAEDAVRISRKLSEQRPDAFLPDLAMSLNNVANRLSALGQREEALQQAEEAVRIRRNLAEQRPDAFLPGLAGSLAVYGSILSLDRSLEAAMQFAEAMRILTPFFLKLPQPHLPLMGFIRGAYLRAADTAKIVPDPELLGPVAAIFEKLETPPDRS